jgi:uncharacterized membrane protein
MTTPFAKKITAKSFRRKEMTKLPAYIIGFIGLSVLVTGIWKSIETLVAIGILMLGVATGLFFYGKVLYELVFRR